MDTENQEQPVKVYHLQRVIDRFDELKNDMAILMAEQKNFVTAKELEARLETERLKAEKSLTDRLDKEVHAKYGTVFSRVNIIWGGIVLAAGSGLTTLVTSIINGFNKHG